MFTPLDRHKVIGLDLETLDTVATAQIIQVGLYYNEKKNLEISIDPSSYKDYPEFTFSHETQSWWDDQPNRAEVFSGKTHVQDVPKLIIDFVQSLKYISNTNTRDMYVCANGASFDFPILEHLFYTLGYLYPFNYSKYIDVKTLRKFKPEVKFPKSAHIALSDAYDNKCWLYEAGLIV
jgi:hypothetical protein